MELFPSKRRKLSSDAASPGSVPVAPSQITTSPDAARITPSRPSFAAPTKASIARYYPQLLTRPSSAGAVDGRQRGSDGARRAIRAGSAPETPSKAESLDTIAVGSMKKRSPPAKGEGEQQVEAKAPSRKLSPKAQPTRPSEGSSAIARSPPRKISPNVADPLDRLIDARSAKETESNATVRAILDALKPIDFPGPPVESQAKTSTHSHEIEKDVQPDLPPTPVQRGLEDPIVTTPPSGIHNTPSKKSKRTRGAKIKPSPLKPPLKPDPGLEVGRSPKRQRILEYPARNLVSIDPYAEKRKTRERLLKEVEQLEEDVAIAERENERQRLHQSTKIPTEPSNSDELVSLLQRWTTESSTKQASSKPSSVFQAIGLFLPFAPRPRPKITMPPEEISVSHLPVLQDDQLPYLQLFTPLAYTSTVTLLPPTPPSSDAMSSSDELFQNHIITAKEPSGIFSARLSMTVNTPSFSISHLEIEGLDACAEAEFGRWARERARGRGFLGRDVNAICIAMGRWYEMALRRARFWCTLESELGSEDGRRQSKERLKVRRKRRNRSASDETEEQREEGVDALELEDGKETVWTRRQLLPQMKRSSLVLTNDTVELLVEWTIVIDWTGEAESCVSASAQVPSSCTSLFRSLSFVSLLQC